MQGFSNRLIENRKKIKLPLVFSETCNRREKCIALFGMKNLKPKVFINSAKRSSSKITEINFKIQTYQGTMCNCTLEKTTLGRTLSSAGNFNIMKGISTETY